MNTAQAQTWSSSNVFGGFNIKNARQRIDLQLICAGMAQLESHDDYGTGRQHKSDLVQYPDSEQISRLQSLLNQSDYAAAKTLAQSLTIAFPAYGFAWHVMGALDLQQGQVDAALTCLKTAVELLPGDAEVHNNYGCALERHSRLLEAELNYQKAIAINSGFALALHNLGVVQRELGRFRESAVSLRAAAKILPEYANAFFNLALTLKKLNQYEEAELSFRRALQIQPDHTHALVGLGNLLANFGRFNEAEHLFQKVLQTEPANLPAWSAITEIRKMTRADTAWLASAAQVRRACQTPRDASRYHFARGKYCDDVGDYEKAFQHYQQANRLASQIAVPYDPDAEAAAVERIRAGFLRSRIFQSGASSSERPVFIVGMPRSGTSLAEQIIATHSQVAGGGELQFWSGAMNQIMAMSQTYDLDPATIQYLAQTYLQELDEVSTGALRIIDKGPDNFRNLGLIHAVFPHARIIHLQRNPIDTCLSIFFQDFGGTFSYANDLSHLAHYYRQYQRLMAHWRKTLPAAQFLEVPYQGLVSDQEQWTRKIIAFAGLKWEPGCMQFQDTRRMVDTASLWQVRQKMYATSLGRWRHYEQFIGPLLGLSEQG